MVTFKCFYLKFSLITAILYSIITELLQ